MTSSLEGRRAIVTGAADGIGLATALLFAERGAKVLAVDLQTSKLKQALEGHESIVILHQDVAAEDAAENIVQAVDREFAGLDVVVNNAGVCPLASLEDTDADSWARAFAINVDATMRISRRALPLLKKSPNGRIVNIGSLNSVLGGEYLGAYTTSKHAVAGLTKTMALEWGRFGITANYLIPGAIITGLTRDIRNDDEGFRNFWEGKSALGRWGEPEDIARAIAFLASDDAAFVTGHGLVVDGGVLVAP